MEGLWILGGYLGSHTYDEFHVMTAQPVNVLRSRLARNVEMGDDLVWKGGDEAWEDCRDGLGNTGEGIITKIDLFDSAN